jgi:hypothetical protein
MILGEDIDLPVKACYNVPATTAVWHLTNGPTYSTTTCKRTPQVPTGAGVAAGQQYWGWKRRHRAGQVQRIGFYQLSGCGEVGE